jgi:hypothetical protein
MRAGSFMQYSGLTTYPEFVKLSYHLAEHDVSHYMLIKFRGERSFLIGNNPKEDITISNGRLIQ